MMNWIKKYLVFLAEKKNKILLVLVAIVLFCTIYALILPALSMDETIAVNQNGVELLEGTSIDSKQTIELQETTEKLHVGEDKTEDTISVAETITSLTETESDSGQTFTQEAQLNTPEAIEKSSSNPVTFFTGKLIHEGLDYWVEVDVSEESQLPSGTELIVKELPSNDESYKEYLDKTKEQVTDATLVYARFFDISFYLKGEEIEPAEAVTVTIKYSTPFDIGKDTELVAVHFDDEKNANQISVESDVHSSDKFSEVTFDTGDFSVYGVLGIEKLQARSIPVEGKEYYEVKFVYKDVDNCEQVVTSKLIEVTEQSIIGSLPQAPFKTGYRFINWVKRGSNQVITPETLVTNDMIVEAHFEIISIYTITINYYYYNKELSKEIIFDTAIFQKEDRDMPFSHLPHTSTKVTPQNDNTLPADATYYPEWSIIKILREELVEKDLADGLLDNKITINIQYVPYTAEFDYVYMLKDLDGNDYSKIETVHAYGVLGSTVSPQVLTYPYATFEHTEATEITQASGQKLYVYYRRNRFTLTYNSNGGDYVNQQTGQYGSQVPISSSIPTRTGYDFAGWYDNPQLNGSPVTDTVTLDKDRTLYAKWTGKTVKYTVVYLKEIYDNATASTHYDYERSAVQEAKVGSTVYASSANGIDLGQAYEMNVGMNADSKAEIMADGSTVLKVYYKLKLFTFIFAINASNGRIRMGGVTYSWSDYHISNVVLGQDISSRWPSGTEQVYATSGGKKFDSWDHPGLSEHFKTKRFEVTEDMLRGADPSNQIIMTGNWSDNMISKSVEYYLQSADNPRTYIKSDTYSQTFYQRKNVSLNAKDIKGFNRLTNTPPDYSSSEDNIYRFYYNRKKYTIDYYFGSQKLKNEEVKFDANLNTSYYNYTPNRPTGMDEDYTWGGWCADSELLTPYTFVTMPDHNVILYAKWVVPTFTVFFETNGGTQHFPTQTVEKHRQISYPGNPTRDDYDFVGWYTHPTGGERYDWLKPVTANITLYARWKLKPLTYIVRYLEEGSNNPLSVEKVETSPAFSFGQEIKESALGIVGYRPYEREKKFTLNNNNQMITFYYTKKSPKITYKIRYVSAINESIEVAPTIEREVDGNTIEVLEKAVPVDKSHMQGQEHVTAEMVNLDYYPLTDVESTVLSATDTENVITFKYASYDTAQITINYLDMDGQAIPGQESVTILQKKPSYYLVHRKLLDGYQFHHSMDNHGQENLQFYNIDGSQHQSWVINLYYKKTITLTANSKSKVYDGLALTSSDLGDLQMNYQDYLMKDDRIVSVEFEGSQTDVGLSAIIPKNADIKDINDVNRTYYYDIQYETGNLEVTKRPLIVTVTGENKEKIYDGQPETITYSVAFIDETGKYTDSDYAYIGQEVDQQLIKTDAGNYSLNLQHKFINNNHNFDVEFIVIDGRLNIKQRLITLRSEDGIKPYDGSMLKKTSVKVIDMDDPTTTGFAEGESFIYSVTGSQMVPGSSLNTYTYAPSPSTKLENYVVIQEEGILKVIPTINLQKTDSQWKPLAGGQFTLTKWDGNHWSAITDLSNLIISTTEGVSVHGLEAGLYRINEQAAPEGYIVLDVPLFFKVLEEVEGEGHTRYVVLVTNEAGEPIESSVAKLQVSENGEVFSHRIQIANEPGQALPNTGGIGKEFYIWCGLIILLSCLFSTVYMKYKWERRAGDY
ncbi:ribonuclease G [Streptococcus suis]|nr:ribonuclease G [Streptococcus suis]